jgi:hypothetical protein
MILLILCEWDAPEGHPGMLRTPVCFRILSSSLTSVSIFSGWCYSSVSISMKEAAVCDGHRQESKYTGDGHILMYIQS